jgi:glycyl-tRNA synthetase
MELEFFCKPGTDLTWFDYWRTYCHDWLMNLGLQEGSTGSAITRRKSSPTIPMPPPTLNFSPFGWGELWGVADRTDYDLKAHQETSGESMDYFDQETGEKYIPYVIEPSLARTA